MRGSDDNRTLYRTKRWKVAEKPCGCVGDRQPGRGPAGALICRILPQSSGRRWYLVTGVLLFPVLLILGTCATSSASGDEDTGAPPYELDLPDEVRPPYVRLTDGERDISLLGTVHSVPEQHSDELLYLPQDVRRDLEEADVVLVESDVLLMDAFEQFLVGAAVRSQYREAAPNEGRPSLRYYLLQRDLETRRAITEGLAERFDLTPGAGLDEFLGLRPWAARDELRSFRRDARELEMASGMDRYIVDEARRIGVELRYLEQWEDVAELWAEAEQSNYVEYVAFTSTIDADEERLAEANRRHMRNRIENWARGGLGEYTQTGYHLLGESIPAEMEDAWMERFELVLVRREELWADRVEELLEDEPEIERVFVAVGAAHVAAEPAVFEALLNERGFVPVRFSTESARARN